uniref:Kin of IRRE-like protein 1 n=1 Tax=Elaeophora elaphi TaxID=1147741 RepID=A0A0R3S396_9BILA
MTDTFPGMKWSPVYIIIIISTYTYSQQRIVEGPTDTRVLIGSTALLKCRIEAQQGAVQWMKNGFGLGNDRDLSLFERYSMEGRISRGEYNLRIINVQMDDDDEYACQVEAANENPTRVSNLAKLTVLVKPEDPKLLLPVSNLRTVVGQHIQRSCTSTHGKPQAKIGWVISDDPNASSVSIWLGDSKNRLNPTSELTINGQEIQNARVVEYVNSNDDRTYSVISNISFAPRVEDDDKYLVCLVSHETYKTPRSHAVRLDLNYPPRVEVKLDNNSKLHEHGSAQLFCNVKAKPFENIKIAWYRNGKAIALATSNKIMETLQTLSISELKIDHHQSEYTCVATNVIGDSSDSVVLNITYGAYIMSREQHQAVNPGETASFICEAIGNPPPTIYWTKVADNQIIARGSNLTIESVQSWQRGEYECVATVQGFPPARLVNYLHIRGPPSVSLSDEIVAAVGESLEIICEVRGRPQPHDVLWSLNGITFEYGRLGGRFQIHQVPRQFGVESRLVIQNVKDSDFGTYNCSAYNELGMDYQTVQLRPKSIVDAFIGNRSALLTFQEYMSVPQSNPHCYYLSSSPVVNRSIYKACASHSFDCGINEQNIHVNHPYNSFASSASTAAVTVSEPYRYQNSKVDLATSVLCQFKFVGGPLVKKGEKGQSKDQFLYSTLGIKFNQICLTSKISIQGCTLTETMSKVSTSDAECAGPLQNGAVRMQERPISQISTHV